MYRELDRQPFKDIKIAHDRFAAGNGPDLKRVFMGIIKRSRQDLIEVGETDRIFTNPRHKLTEDYITGRFG